jgi:hypothetical protein
VRRPVRAVAVLAAVAAAGACWPAAAAAFHPDQVEMARAIKAGDEFWRHDPQNHCLGHNGGTIDTTFPARHSTAAAYTVDGVCGAIHILLSRAEQYTRAQFCVLVVHEYGHTINHQHVADPTNIMYARPVTAGFDTPVCHYPDPHGPGTSPGETHRIRKKAELLVPPPPRPRGLPSSFEILTWTGSADLWR